MCVVVVLFVVDVWTELVSVIRFGGPVVKGASHVHSKLLQFLVVLLHLAHFPFLVPAFVLRSQVLFGAPDHQGPLFYLDV